MITLYIGYQKGLQESRSQVATTTALSSAFLVVSFCRASLGQTGTGHFSPVAGYSAEEDRVLVLDVARFKSYYTILSYSPFLEKSNSGVHDSVFRFSHPAAVSRARRNRFLREAIMNPTNCLSCNPNPPSIIRSKA
ncbi:hypothetical protein PGT21_006108 [Puccinia graminis f. sp. tritici]|uniref:glutathione gamma-glutamylcysteinyltransferase n=1 Tax=Puccinia graminis f. sp. tritici TaxID=56615 RepID=A0A5B0PWY1_PUCGR|nr:hypothetical protein PGTUg99_026044 [Puccinia graminis f. sp. tritici]KAA1105401.1 hypothetical protein PGT21_006108 [Puccinia graminis f. sp. tritici]